MSELDDPSWACSAVAIAGPTAVGKSAVAIELALRLNGEIVSVDSMQVYKGLDIGTAKPSPSERTQVPHHLLDVLELDQPFDAAQFVRLAEAACVEIRSRNRVPILCGGTGLYFKALLEGIGGGPPGDPKLRSELERVPQTELLRELQDRDPGLYERIDRNNPRRVVRAIEVIRLTGRPFSELRVRWARALEGEQALPHNRAVPFFGIARGLEDLRRRIDERVDAMFAAGLIEEIRSLLDHGLAQNKTAMQAIGYKQVVEYLQRFRTLEETVALVKQRTRQYAKRQLTWFRRQAAVQWIQVAPDESASAVADRIAQQLHRRARD